MADIHVEEFYKDVAIALVQLYGAFPRRVNLFVEDLAGSRRIADAHFAALGVVAVHDDEVARRTAANVVVVGAAAAVAELLEARLDVPERKARDVGSQRELAAAPK